MVLPNPPDQRHAAGHLRHCPGHSPAPGAAHEARGSVPEVTRHPLTSRSPRRTPASPTAFARRLLARQRLIGCWCSLANPITTEVLGLAGFDWLLLDAEHAPNDVTTLIPQLMALKDSPSAPVVRPPWNDAVIIKRLLDAGFYNFLIPVRRVGRGGTPRGRGDTLPARRHPRRVGLAAQQPLRHRARLPEVDQREHRRPGADRKRAPGWPPSTPSRRWTAWTASSSGPSDLAAALGHLGNAAHPDVQQAIRHIFDARAGRGQGQRASSRRSRPMRGAISSGALTFVAVGSDLGVFRAATQALRDKFPAAG